MAETAEKKYCGKCRTYKDATPENFYIDNKTGKLKSVCKECRRVYSRQYGKNHCGRIRRDELAGCENWQQAESFVRAIAELQNYINYETTKTDVRIETIQAETETVVGPVRATLDNLRLMLKKFIKDQAGKNKQEIIRKMRFGNIRYIRGKLDLQLNLNLAAKCSGKP